MGSGFAFRCEVCDVEPTWSIARRGDAAVTWACAAHVSEVLDGMQRDWEVTELTVTLREKAVEWSTIGETLRRVGEGESA